MHQIPLQQLKSPKRKRGEDEDSTLPLPVLQTNVLPTDRYRRRMSDSEPNDGDVSPRSVMSGRFRQMDLRGSPTKVRRRSTQDDTAMTTEQVSESEIARTSSPVSDPRRSGPCHASVTSQVGSECQIQPAQDTNASRENESSYKGKAISETQESHSPNTPRKRARQSPAPSNSNLNVNTSEPAQDTDSIDQEELLRNWWQPEEISGFSADDPDEDAYGVNGVGYQKTPAQQWKIDQKKRQQVAEWRNREAREARAARAGGRRALRRAVTPSIRSRSGSPTNTWSPPDTKLSASQGTAAPETPKSARKVHFTVE